MGNNPVSSRYTNHGNGNEYASDEYLRHHEIGSGRAQSDQNHRPVQNQNIPNNTRLRSGDNRQISQQLQGISPYTSTSTSYQHRSGSKRIPTQVNSPQGVSKATFTWGQPGIEATQSTLKNDKRRSAVENGHITRGTFQADPNGKLNHLENVHFVRKR
ncbi:hypothetical protein [Burkholderia sp. WAC0059]|uniref:hypothetical protein n=1 Tax=Burkholderia sp. WAC0059 TaxID=2066022 RepID=UPI0011AF6421|nr:hypothetical protein [Burkholderia sp. WAC0059]